MSIIYGPWPGSGCGCSGANDYLTAEEWEAIGREELGSDAKLVAYENMPLHDKMRKRFPAIPIHTEEHAVFMLSRDDAMKQECSWRQLRYNYERVTRELKIWSSEDLLRFVKVGRYRHCKEPEYIQVLSDEEAIPEWHTDPPKRKLNSWARVLPVSKEYLLPVFTSR
jgi:hypothetical protein